LNGAMVAGTTRSNKNNAKTRRAITIPAQHKALGIRCFPQSCTADPHSPAAAGRSQIGTPPRIGPLPLVAYQHPRTAHMSQTESLTDRYRASIIAANWLSPVSCRTFRELPKRTQRTPWDP
jgi:hypothetical protein